MSDHGHGPSHGPSHDAPKSSPKWGGGGGDVIIQWALGGVAGLCLGVVSLCAAFLGGH